MSAAEEPTRESRSSVQITLNAKREAQTAVKVYVGDSEEDLAEALRIATVTFLASLTAIGGAA